MVAFDGDVVDVGFVAFFTWSGGDFEVCVPESFPVLGVGGDALFFEWCAFGGGFVGEVGVVLGHGVLCVVWGL